MPGEFAIPAASVRAIVQEHFLLRKRIGGSLGHMLESARLGLVVDPSSGDAHALLVRYCDITRLLRDLTVHEYAVVLLRYCGADGYEHYHRSVAKHELFPLAMPFGDLGGTCNARTSTGRICRQWRVAGRPRCHWHDDVMSAPATHVTRAGEEYVCEAEVDGWALVSGVRARLLPLEDIARVLAITERQAMSRLYTARIKIMQAAQGEYLADADCV